MQQIRCTNAGHECNIWPDIFSSTNVIKIFALDVVISFSFQAFLLVISNYIILMFIQTVKKLLIGCAKRASCSSLISSQLAARHGTGGGELQHSCCIRRSPSPTHPLFRGSTAEPSDVVYSHPCLRGLLPPSTCSSSHVQPWLNKGDVEVQNHPGK